MQSFYQLSKQIYDMKNPREVRRAIIFCVRAWLHRGKLQELDAFFRKDAMLSKLADIYPFVYEQPTRAFFYNKSTFDERVRIVEGSCVRMCSFRSINWNPSHCGQGPNVWVRN